MKSYAQKYQMSDLAKKREQNKFRVINLTLIVKEYV